MPASRSTLLRVRRELLDWYARERRDFPWRGTRDPYAVLVSEVMLQQTQAARVAERFPRIRWVLAPLGGAIPYVAERLDRGFHAFRECHEHIPRPPSECLKRFYYDTVNFDPAALALAIRFAGADHILAGSDYPHRIGSIEQMRESIAALDLSEGDRKGILGGNARRLLGM